MGSGFYMSYILYLSCILNLYSICHIDTCISSNLNSVSRLTGLMAEHKKNRNRETWQTGVMTMGVAKHKKIEKKKIRETWQTGVMTMGVATRLSAMSMGMAKGPAFALRLRSTMELP